MKAQELKDILREIRPRDIRGELIKNLLKSPEEIKSINGPYRSERFLKNLLVKPFNYLNKKQYLINEHFRSSLQIIAGEIRANFNDSLKDRHPAGTPRIAVFVPFDFTPADFGGGTRVYNLYNQLSRSFVVDAVAVVDYGIRRCAQAYNNNFTAHIVPQSRDYADLKEAEEEKIGGRFHDILLIDQYHLIPELVDLCKSLSYHIDCAITSHPFMFNMLAEICADKILIYEAHNIESELKRTYFPEDNNASRAYLKKVRDVEERACRESDIIFTVSQSDKNYMCQHFNIDTDKIVMAESGADIRRSTFISMEKRRALKSRLGIEKPLIIFVGSNHGPNIEAVDFIIGELAPLDKSVRYIIGGSIAEHYQSGEQKGLIPDNVLLIGILTEEEKEALYNIGDLAINPMFSGSGTNQKIFDYGAHGLPILSTSFGIRGAPELRTCVTLSEKNDFLNAIREQLKKENMIAKKGKVYTCRKIIEEKYNWEIIAKKMADSIMELCNKKALLQNS